MLNDGISDGRTSSSVGHFALVDHHNGGFLEKPVKEEEPEDADYLCKKSDLASDMFLMLIVSL